MNSPQSPTSPTSGGWRDLVEQSWPAIAASELLRGSDEVWNEEGFGVPRAEEAVVLAAAGRVIRFGQSVNLSLPINGEPTLTRLAFYLHRLRLDAAGGLVRSTWLNPVQMANRNDLIVFGRPQRMVRDFSTSVVMRPTVVDGIRPLEHAEYQRTLLVSGHGHLLELLSLLSTRSQPFAILVQATPQGCDENSVKIINVLPEFFPGVPIVALGYTGQVLSQPLRMHTWNMRLGDVVALRQATGAPALKAKMSPIEVVAARDPIMDAFVQRLGYMVWALKSKMEEVGGISQELSGLLAVERILKCLNVPLQVYEQGILRRTRAGRYPIRSIGSWLEIASRLKGRRGDIQELHSKIMIMVQGMIKGLEGANPGRSEAIINICSEAFKSYQNVTLLVGAQRDAEILQNYVEQRLGPESIRHIRVIPMDGANTRPPEMVDLVIYAGLLFPSRIHWLGLNAAAKLVLCHPFEQQRVCIQIDRWLRSHALPSSPTGDKEKLWRFEWPSAGYLLDEQVDDAAPDISLTSSRLLEMDGDYPRQMRVAQLETTRGYEDWLSVLLTEPTVVHHGDETASDNTRQVVVVHLEGQHEPIRWSINHQVLRLEGEELEVCAAKNLAVGNDLLLLVSSEERVATQRDLFDMFIQDYHGLSQTLRIAEKWQDLVDSAILKYTTAAHLNRFLKSKRLEVHNSTIQNWIHGGVIGPQNPDAIRLLAELAELPNPKEMASMVSNAINIIRSEHRRIGSDLRRAITLSRNRDVSAVKIGSRRFSRDVFDSMVQLARVERIEHPPHDFGTSSSSRSIRDLALEFARSNCGKLIFTARCDRSMKTSIYSDLNAFAKVLKVLVDGFYPMYATKSKSLREVEDMLRQIPASYAGGMSDVTKGKSEQAYFVNYEGQRVDISRHIKLGRTFNPRYTLRLHFHWDSDRCKIVVHHAGQHLPTLAE